MPAADGWLASDGVEGRERLRRRCKGRDCVVAAPCGGSSAPADCRGNMCMKPRIAWKLLVCAHEYVQFSVSSSANQRPWL